MISVSSSAVIGSLTEAYRWATEAGLAAVGTEQVLFEHAHRPSAAARKAIAAGALAEICRLIESGAFQARGNALAPAVPPFAVESALREARWEALRSLPRGSVKEAKHLPQWTEELRSGVREAVKTAKKHGAQRPHGEHMLLGVLADPGSGASRLLAAAGQERSATIGALLTDHQLGVDGKAWLPAVETLQVTGVITGGPLATRTPYITRLVTRLMGRLASGVRLAGGHGNPVAACLQTESIRQAVLLGDATVAPRHILLAILALDEQLTAAAQSLPRRIAAQNTAAALLVEGGLAYDQTVTAAGQLGADTAETVTEAPGLLYAPDEPETPQWTLTGATIWGSARANADRSGHKHTGTTHVLLALLDDPSGEAARLLKACETDPVLVREQAAASLAGSPTA